MHLTRYTDYAIRTLIHLATYPDRLSSIAEIARAYDISQNHLMKVVNDLANSGYILSTRGRFGGIQLARPAEQINVGEVVRHTEGSFVLADCDHCVIQPACGVTRALREATTAFLNVLDRYALADMVANHDGLAMIFATRRKLADDASSSKAT